MHLSCLVPPKGRRGGKGTKEADGSDEVAISIAAKQKVRCWCSVHGKSLGGLEWFADAEFYDGFLVFVASVLRRVGG